MPNASAYACFTPGNHRCAHGGEPGNMYSTSGVASSGRVLMNARMPLGIVVAGPEPRTYARSMFIAMRSNRIRSRNGPGALRW